MKKSGFEEKHFLKYLELLGIPRKNPSYEYLKEIVHTQISKVPFENISKLFFKKRLNLKQLISFELYLEGIEKYSFGGTCYANNFYFNQLLNWLGFEAKLCGADMKAPNVHMVNIVKVENREFLIDAGYAAPFFEPFPLNSPMDFSIKSGDNLYVLNARKNNERPQLEMYRNGELAHGYKVNLQARSIDDFQQVIEESFDESSNFMKSLLITQFEADKFTIIHNMSITEIKGSVSKTISVDTIYDLATVIDKRCGIPRAIVLESLEGFQMQKDSWD